MLRNTDKQYGSMAKWLHWISAVLIVGMLILGYFVRTGPEATFGILIAYHKFFAVILFVVMLFRVIWRWANPTPSLSGMPRHQAIAAHINHWLLYLCIFVMLFAGWFMTSFGGHPMDIFGMNLALPLTINKPVSHLFGSIHYWTSWVLFCLIILHILAALFHQFILRDKLVNRMLPQKKRNLF